MASQACCNVPPKGEPAVLSEDQIDQVAGTNIYVFGDRNAKRAVVLVCDIFGLYQQTKQGAAFLAKELDCLVITPDFFNGEGANLEWSRRKPRISIQALKNGPFLDFAGEERFLDVADAKGMTIPHICLVSPDEPADILKPYEEALPPHSEFELYGTMFHGWMGAQANLESEENVREFNRGYKQVATFFNRWL
ncbi:hypothetical protein PENFLA_c007G02038 [Penicillium flavigenum]|uniref:Dienelactone hydrolase domain-containing protein n=1 Tax=Penicillium flavigenum TaxID=254877 RepID=A0A1V6TJZ0_9EURO|nr:hypothetical protein PENFLA_c007G02038 [Penicillium flavigenum]